MPLSFLTRRGSKKTPSKGDHNRNGSKTVEVEADLVAPATDGQSMPRAPVTQPPSVKRRATAATVDPEDVFLNIAGDHDSQTRTGKSQHRGRSKSIPEPQRPTAAAAAADDHDKTSTLKYLQSLSQRTIRPAEKRRSVQPSREQNKSSDQDDKASTAGSRSLAKKPNGPNNGETRHSKRVSDTVKTPSPERPSLRQSELAYSTPEAFEAIQAPKSAGLENRGSVHKNGWMHNDGLDSEVSTAATSTVWDELNELKSRMRKLESSGGKSRYHSSAEPGDRPKTAATTANTFNSASRRSSNNDHLSPTWSRPRPLSQDLTDSNPLLHSALRKARLVIERDVFNALEASASDALQMATLARAENSNDASSSLTTDTSTQSQKQILRKADNLCRSMTELCIVLCEQKRTRSPERTTKSFDHRPSSSDLPNGSASVNGDDDSNSPLGYLDQRRRFTDRMERLNARHTARAADSMPNRLSAARNTSVVDHNSKPPWTPKSVSRAATTKTHSASRSNEYNIPQDPADLVDDDEDQNFDKESTIRGSSRAATDLSRRTAGTSGAQSHSPRDLRMSRDYTSKHPLPEALSPRIRKALEAKNQSAHSLAQSDRTLRPSVNAAKGTTVRTTEVNIPVEDGSPLSPTSNSASAASRRSFASISPERGSESDQISDSGRDRREREREWDTEQGRRASASARSPRLPPSTGVGLAERLEAKRQQRAASGATVGSSRR